MKNIVLITSLYPADDIKIENNTAVCHYFAKEWIKMGYNVRVINLYNEYPIYYYPILKIAKSYFADRFGIAILDKKVSEVHNYVIDDIRITRIPIRKSRPRGEFSEKAIYKVTEKIYSILQSEGYVPDFILGHFIRPSIRIIASLKNKYPLATTTIALHGKEFNRNLNIDNCLNKIDFVGYRSYPIKENFESLYGKKPFFMCMSGVPSEYIIKHNRTFNKPIRTFIYVGTFMRRKYPSILIPAVANNYQNNDFMITYIGSGNGIKDIISEAKHHKVLDNITFTGRIPRLEINSQYDKADVFIMISKNETFGLVWLEAMARGCITVASKDEGMDGIIKDGENGFLCKAGDKEELEKIIRQIKAMDSKSLQKMSKNAIETAKNMTDSQMAYKYIKMINKL